MALLPMLSLSPQSVALIVKAELQSYDDPTNYSGHSLRSGLVTSAALAGVSSWKIREQTGHKSDAMLARYIQNANIFIKQHGRAILLIQNFRIRTKTNMSKSGHQFTYRSGAKLPLHRNHCSLNGHDFKKQQ